MPVQEWFESSGNKSERVDPIISTLHPDGR